MSKKKYFEHLHKNITDGFELLQKKYSINDKDKQTFFDFINKAPPVRKKNKVSPNDLCRARKQDGERCTRRKKDGIEFCGKHINNRRYGCYDDNNNIVDHNKLINLKKILIKNEYYYIDENNILYNISSKKGMYTIVGKLMDTNSQEIFWVSSLST